MRVELHEIKKYFGDVRANDGITLTFEPGRIYGLLGENGAGKSTLMKILSGYQAPTSGQISLNGEATTFASPTDALAKGVGMLYQDPLDFPPLRVIENHLLAHDDHVILDFSQAEGDLNSYGGRFGFEVEDPHVFVENLTLGERQQLELLRQLSLGAEFLILDEPTTGISAEQKDILFGTMRRLAHEEQKTIVLVSHKLEEVQELCDAVAVLRAGKLVGEKELPCPTSDLVRMMFGEEINHAARQPQVGEQATIELREASIRTYRLNVEDLNLNIQAGEVLGLAGLEGSGQRLVLQACAGLEPLAEGEVVFDGQILEGTRSPFFWASWLALGILGGGILQSVVRFALGRSSGIGLAGGIVVALLIGGAIWLAGAVLKGWTSQPAYHVFQNRGGAYVPAGRLEEGLIAGLSLTEHMVLASQKSGLRVNWEGTRSTLAERIKQYNVVGRPETHAEELSGGNQQRAMFALLHTPLKLLLLEHPTRGLDVTSANWIWELFLGRRQDGTAIIFISADLDELLERSDRIAVFSGGKLIQIVNTGETSVDQLGHLIGGQSA